MHQCPNCKSTEFNKKIITCLDSHNNMIEYTCKKCNKKDLKIESID